MKRLISVLLVVIMLFSAVVVGASAKQNSNAYGDLDKNKDVTAADALLALQHAVKKLTLDIAVQKYADVDGEDGITAADALLILQFAVGKIDTLPAFNIDPSRELIIDLPESEMNNGAYEYDLTADNSFEVSGDGLEENTIYVFTDRVFNASNTTTTKDGARFVYSFQGLLNRSFGITHTSLLYHVKDTWLERMMEEGKFFEDYQIINITDFETFMETFRVQLEECGIVLWDSNVPATANVAATICGIEGHLPVQYNTGDKSFMTKLFDYADGSGISLDVMMDLRDMFNDAALGEKIVDTDINSTGSSKCDAYLWALDKYADRCSAKYIAYIVDGAVAVEGHELAQRGDAGSPSSICLPNHDYLIARRCFFFDLTCYPTETPCDDKNQPLGADADTMNAIFSKFYDRAGGEIIQMQGFPPWWLKYTTHGGLGSLVATVLEWMTVEVMTAYNAAKEADAAHPCSMDNGSALYKYVSTFDGFVNNDECDDIEFDPDTYYYLFYVGDYDSAAWLKAHMLNFWPDSKRGEIPLMWSFNPNLSYRVPVVWEYVYANKSDKDYFVAGEGAGYVIPSALYQGKKIYDFNERTKPDGMDQWVEYSIPFYETFDMDITGFIINGVNRIDTNIMTAYNKFSPVGSFHNSGSVRLVEHDSAYYVYLQNGLDFNNPEGSAGTMYNHMFSHMNGFNFAAYRTVCASPTQHYALDQAFTEYAEARGKKVQLVDPYTYFRLIKESGQAVPSNEFAW